MIPILYASTETAFTSNGIGKLTDARKCEVTEERNGQYELVLEYPVTGKWAASLQPGAYIYAIHDDHKTPQPFQIYEVSAPLEGFLTVNAWHISYALNYIIVKPFSAGSCSSALQAIPTNSVNTNNFTFWTDKSVTADFETTVPMSARAILGGSQGSILDVYGPGEYEFDKLTVKLHSNRGANRDVTIRYGKNLKSLDQSVDGSNVYNAVLPYWTNGEATVYATSLVVRTGETAKRAVALDMSGSFQDEPTVAQLTAAAQTYIDASSNYQVKENIKVDFVQLWQTEEYKNVANLQRVYLCDTVNVFYSKLGINATAKVIKVVYDTLRERYSEMELGAPRVSLAQQIQADVTGSILAEVPSKGMMQGAIEHATQLISGGSGGYIKFNYAGDGTPTEMLIMDSPLESTAVNIIRLNQNGIGFSTDGGSTYASAWTIDGNFVADFITTGNLNASLLTVGRVQDVSGLNYWDLETGDFQTQRGVIADFTIDQTSLRNGTVGQGTDGTGITAGKWESTKTGTISGSGYTYQYTTKVKISNSGLEMYSSRDDVDADLVQVLKIEPHVWYVNGTARHNVYFSTSAADGYLFAVNKATEVSATAYPLDIYKRTEFEEAVKFDKDVQIGTDLTNANLEVNGTIQADGNITTDGTVKSSADLHVAAGGSPTLMFELPLGTRWFDVAGITAATNGVQRLQYGCFREHSYNSSTGAHLNYYENYLLPAVTPDRTNTTSYDILTTKNSADVGVYSSYATASDLASLNAAIMSKYNNMANGAVAYLRINPSTTISPFGTAYVMMMTIYKINSNYGAVESISYQNGAGANKHHASIWNGAVLTWT